MIEVTNQPPPLVNYNLLLSDTVLREALRREHAEWAEGALTRLGDSVVTADLYVACDPSPATCHP